MAEEKFQEWCVLELMGHRRLFGLVSETEIAGASFLRLDVPGDSPEYGWHATQFYSPSAVYCMTPTSEDLARRMAKENRPEPVHHWELRALEQAPTPVRERFAGADPDDDERYGDSPDFPF